MNLFVKQKCFINLHKIDLLDRKLIKKISNDFSKTIIYNQMQHFILHYFLLIVIEKEIFALPPILHLWPKEKAQGYEAALELLKERN
jgi:hypothetical protein